MPLRSELDFEYRTAVEITVISYVEILTDLNYLIDYNQLID